MQEQELKKEYDEVIRFIDSNKENDCILDLIYRILNINAKASSANNMPIGKDVEFIENKKRTYLHILALIYEKMHLDQKYKEQEVNLLQQKIREKKIKTERELFQKTLNLEKSELHIDTKNKLLEQMKKEVEIENQEQQRQLRYETSKLAQDKLKSEEILILMEILIKRGIPVNQKDDNNNTFLTYVSEMETNKTCFLRVIIFTDIEKITKKLYERQQSIKSTVILQIKSLIDNNVKRYNYILQQNDNKNIIDVFATKNSRGKMLIEEIFATRFRLDIITDLVYTHYLDINMRFQDGKTMAHIAAQNNNLDVLKLLLDLGVGIQDKDSFGKTFIDYISDSEGKKDIEEYSKLRKLQYLVDEIDMGVNIEDNLKLLFENEDVLRNNTEHSLLVYAAKNLKVSFFNVLKKEKSDWLKIIVNNQTTLIDYVIDSNIDDEDAKCKIIDMLIVAGANINKKKESYETHPIYAAIQKNHCKILKTLIDHKALNSLPDNEADLLLSIAVENARRYVISDNIIDVLIKAGCKITDNRGFNLIMHRYFSDSEENPDEIRKRLNTIKRYISDGVLNIDSVDSNGKTLLMYAALSGNQEFVKFLLTKNPNLNLRDNNGYSALIHAAKNGHIDIVKILIYSNVNINQGDNRHETAISHAAENGKLEIVEFLMHENSLERITPIMNAVYKDNFDVFKYLLDFEDILECKDRNGKTILMYAMQGGYTDIINYIFDEYLCYEPEKLKEYVLLEDKFGNDAINYAIIGNNLRTLTDIQKFEISFNKTDKKDNTYLLTAVRKGVGSKRKETIKFLLEKGAVVFKDKQCILPDSTDRQGSSIFMLAAQLCELKVLKLLLNQAIKEKGIINEEKKLQEVKRLVEMQDKDGCNCLIYAAYGGNLETVEYLYNFLDERHRVAYAEKALIYAVKGGHEKIIKFFIDLNINPTNDVLIYGAQVGDIYILDLLLQFNLDVNIQDEFGYTPSMYAIQKGNPGALRLLAKKGARLDLQGKDKVTCMMLACSNGDKDTIDFLLENDVDITKKDQNGKTCIDYAIVNGFLDIAIELSKRNFLKRNLSQEELDIALNKAIRRGDYSNVKLALEKGADISKDKIMLAGEYNNINIINLLLKSIEKKSAYFLNEVLEEAIRYKYISLIECLLLCKVNLNLKNSDGKTPIMLCIANNLIQVIELMIQEGANINLLNNDNRNCLELVLDLGNFGMTILLMKNGSEIRTSDTLRKLISFLRKNENKTFSAEDFILNYRDSKGRSLLTFAIVYEDVDILNELINLGISITDEDIKEAAQFGNEKITNILFKNIPKCDQLNTCISNSPPQVKERIISVLKNSLIYSFDSEKVIYNQKTVLESSVEVLEAIVTDLKYVNAILTDLKTKNLVDSKYEFNISDVTISCLKEVETTRSRSRSKSKTREGEIKRERSRSEDIFDSGGKTAVFDISKCNEVYNLDYNILRKQKELITTFYDIIQIFGDNNSTISPEIKEINKKFKTIKNSDKIYKRHKQEILAEKEKAQEIFRRFINEEKEVLSQNKENILSIYIKFLNRFKSLKFTIEKSINKYYNISKNQSLKTLNFRDHYLELSGSDLSDQFDKLI